MALGTEKGARSPTFKGSRNAFNCGEKGVSQICIVEEIPLARLRGVSLLKKLAKTEHKAYIIDTKRKK